MALGSWYLFFDTETQAAVDYPATEYDQSILLCDRTKIIDTVSGKKKQVQVTCTR